MRKNRWIASIWGMLAAAALGQTATAQGPASPLEGSFPPVGHGPVAPGPVAYPGHPTFTPVAPDAASPAGFPPNMEAWPTISPFEHAFDQTYNDDGIWFREILNHERKYQVNVEFISAKFRQPGHAPIGADSAIGSPQDHLGETRDGVDAFEIYGVKDFQVLVSKSRYFEVTDGPLSIPDPPGAQTGPLPRTPNRAEYQVGNAPFGDDLTFRTPKGGIMQIVNFGTIPINSSIEDTDDPATDEVADTPLYPVTGQVLAEDAVTQFGGRQDIVGERRRDPSSPGLRFSFGLEEEDDTGFNWGAYWISGEPTVFRRGHDDPGMPVVTNIIFFDAPHLGIGTGGFGEAPNNTTNAVEMLDYNTLFELKHETEAGGTDLAFYHTPMVDLGWFRMRPMFGARYDYIRETFHFTGRDNGFAYAFDSDGDAFENDTTDEGAFPTGDQQRFLNVVSSNQVPFTYDPDVLFRDQPLAPYETTVDSKVRSHLYGPQIGFDMQAGGENLMLTAVTKTGVVVDTEKLTLDTAGFGVDEALTGFRQEEHDSKTHTRLVPFLEFNANADINVFPIIPVVNRWQFLKNARIRAGWTAFVVGNMQRPLDQVVWRAQQSGGSYIKERGRDVWYTQYWNVGVHWNF